MGLKKSAAFILAMILLSAVVSGCGQDKNDSKWGINEFVIVLMPGEDSPEVMESRNVFDKALSELIGIPVKEYRATDYTAMVEAMRTGHAHVGNFGPFSYVHAVERSGAECLVVTGRPDGNGGFVHGYYSYLIANAAAGIETMDDLAGKSFGFVDPQSTSGNIIPSDIILDHFANDYPDLTFEDIHINGKFFSSVSFTGTHANSMQGVMRGDIDAAGVTNSTYQAEIDNGNADPDKIIVLNISPLIPTSPIAIQKDLPQELKDIVLQFFLDWDDDDNFWAHRGGVGNRYIRVYDHEYDYIRQLRDRYELTD